MRIRRFLLTLMLIFCLMTCACHAPGTAEWQLYYPRDAASQDSASAVGWETRILSVNMTAQNTARTLLQLLYDEPHTVGFFSLSEYGVSLPTLHSNGSRLQLFFGADYGALPEYDRTLFQYCICQTLLEGTGYSGIQFYADRELLYDSLEAQSEVLVSLDALRAVEYTATLYYPNAAQDGFVEVAANFTLTADKAPETELLQMLRGGTEDSEATQEDFIDRSAQLLSASTSYGICTVNFSSEFLNTNMTAPDGTSLTVYAIVNSLCTLPDITRVQFLIDGELQSSYMHTGFDAPIAPQTAQNTPSSAAP